MLVSEVNTNEQAYSLNLGPTELDTLRSILFKDDGAPFKAKAVDQNNAREKGIAVARRMYKFRRRREERFSQLFGFGLFADPAWDLLLDLYIHSAEAQEVSVSSACLGAAAPETTALRYVGELERMGLIERHRHAADKRVQLVRLTSKALVLMDEMCGQFSEMMQTTG